MVKIVPNKTYKFRLKAGYDYQIKSPSLDPYTKVIAEVRLGPDESARNALPRRCDTFHAKVLFVNKHPTETRFIITVDKKSIVPIVNP